VLIGVISGGCTAKIETRWDNEIEFTPSTLHIFHTEVPKVCSPCYLLQTSRRKVSFFSFRFKKSPEWKIPPEQGCQMVSFWTKNHNLGKFWRALDCKMLIYFMAIRNIFKTSVIFYDHLCKFVTFFPVLVSCTKKNLATLHWSVSATWGWLYTRDGKKIPS
jgi:hypothetical protein